MSRKYLDNIISIRCLLSVINALLIAASGCFTYNRALSQERRATIYYKGPDDFAFVLHVLKATIESRGQSVADVADVSKSNVIALVLDDAFSVNSEINKLIYNYGLFDALKDNLDKTRKMRELVSFPCTSFDISLNPLSNRELKRIFLLVVDSKIDKNLVFECVNRTISNNYKL